MTCYILLYCIMKKRPCASALPCHLQFQQYKKHQDLKHFFKARGLFPPLQKKGKQRILVSALQKYTHRCLRHYFFTHKKIQYKFHTFPRHFSKICKHLPRSANLPARPTRGEAQYGCSGSTYSTVHVQKVFYFLYCLLNHHVLQATNI